MRISSILKENETPIVDRKEAIAQLMAKKKALQDLLISRKDVEPSVRARVAQGLSELNRRLEELGLQINEAHDYEELRNTVERAISYRIMRNHVDLIEKYGLDQVTNAIADVASSVAQHDLEEIGSSDVSAWVRYVMSDLSGGKEMQESYSDVSGLLAASHLNRTFIITADVDGKTKKFRVYAQSERVAREKFKQHYSMTPILDVHEKIDHEPIKEDDDTITFAIDSEKAYQAVMKRYDNHINWSGEYMVAPRKLWSRIQTIAHENGGKAAEVNGLTERSIKKYFSRSMAWSGPEHLKDIIKYIRNADDETLIILARNQDEFPIPHTPRDLQVKLINQELKRRYKIKPSKTNEDSTGKITLYVDEKPATTYANQIEASADLERLQEKFPNKKLELKQEVCQTKSISQGNEMKINEVRVPAEEIESLLDEAAEHIGAAIDALRQADRAGRSVPHPFSGQLRAYIIPHLESWIDNENQIGSIVNLKKILYNERS